MIQQKYKELFTAYINKQYKLVKAITKDNDFSLFDVCYYIEKDNTNDKQVLLNFLITVTRVKHIN